MILFNVGPPTIHDHHYLGWALVVLAMIGIAGAYADIKRHRARHSTSSGGTSMPIDQLVARCYPHQMQTYMGGGGYAGGGLMGMPYQTSAGAPNVMLAPPYITDKPGEAYLSDGTRVLVQGHG